MKQFADDNERVAYLQNILNQANYYIYERQLNLVIRAKSMFMAPSTADASLLWDIRDRSDCNFPNHDASALLGKFAVWDPPEGNDALTYALVSDCYPVRCRS